MKNDNKLLNVEVAYALPDEQQVVPVQILNGTTLKEAIEQSGLLDRFPSIDIAHAKVGIYSKMASLETLLREGDRVEIYRPLKIDPKEIRKQRAAQKQK